MDLAILRHAARIVPLLVVMALVAGCGGAPTSTPTAAAAPVATTAPAAAPAPKPAPAQAATPHSPNTAVHLRRQSATTRSIVA